MFEDNKNNILQSKFSNLFSLVSLLNISHNVLDYLLYSMIIHKHILASKRIIVIIPIQKFEQILFSIRFQVVKVRFTASRSSQKLKYKLSCK